MFKALPGKHSLNVFYRTKTLETAIFKKDNILKNKLSLKTYFMFIFLFEKSFHAKIIAVGSIAVMRVFIMQKYNFIRRIAYCNYASNLITHFGSSRIIMRWRSPFNSHIIILTIILTCYGNDMWNIIFMYVNKA